MTKNDLQTCVVALAFAAISDTGNRSRYEETIKRVELEIERREHFERELAKVDLT